MILIITVIILVITIILIPVIIITTRKHGKKGGRKKDNDTKVEKIPTDEYRFVMDNGLNLRYGEILALAGDIYGTDKPICDGETEKEKEDRFIDAFNTLNKSDGTENAWSRKFGESSKEVPDILKQINIEIDGIKDYLNKGKDPSVFYEKSGNDFDVVYNQDTGGGTKVIPKKIKGVQILDLLKKGRYMQLATLNWDHFVQNGGAWSAYTTGHNIAKRIASKAATRDDLELAYKYNAFASHFLSDYFASGHLRTPRKALHYGHPHPENMKLSDKILYKINPISSSTLGDLMSRLMHDEDNKKGLWVKTRDGCNQFKTFGDGHYANNENRESREQQRKVLQESILEVWKSFIGEKIYDGGDTIWNMLPDPGSVDKDKRNHPAMFQLDNGLITKRKKGDKRTVVIVQTETILEFEVGSNKVSTVVLDNEKMFYPYVH